MAGDVIMYSVCRPYLDQEGTEEAGRVGAGEVVDARDELRDDVEPGGGGDGAALQPWCCRVGWWW